MHGQGSQCGSKRREGEDKRLIALSQETRLWETNIPVSNNSFGNMLKKYAFPNFGARKILNIFVFASKLFQGNFNMIDLFTSHFWSDFLGFRLSQAA